MGNNTVHAFTDDLLASHDAVALADLVRRGEVSPVELTEAAIARVEKVNGALNAVKLATYERALAEAAERRGGPFAGVPTFVKDNTDLAGLPTRHGSRAVPEVPAPADDAFARQYLSLGFTVLGKTNLPEFGFNCSTEYQGEPPTVTNAPCWKSPTNWNRQTLGDGSATAGNLNLKPAKCPLTSFPAKRSPAFRKSRASGTPELLNGHLTPEP